MDELRNRLLALLQRLRLSEPEHAEYVAAIQSATAPVELRVIIAELMTLAGDDLLAIADGLEATGSPTEAGRTRGEARLAHAPLQALFHWRERMAKS
jgi:hypothetical protein